jgi:glycerol-3-phosphate acyltransferase PlsX
MSVAEKNKSISADKNVFIIAIDAMGGDNAPDSVIKALNIITERNPAVKFKIYGNKKRVYPIISAYSAVEKNHEFFHAEDVIENDEKPSNALRKGKNSSMFMAINAVKNKEANAIVSAGNTGALMALSKFQLQTLPRIDRPAIGGILPNEKGFSVMLDLGANVHCEAENLFEFAIMGNAFSRAVFGIENPSIGLLNVGAEKNKGNEYVKAALNLLQESGIKLNLHGFVEGDDISLGTTDVIVADGFSGNIALKTVEGIARLYTKTLKNELKKDPLSYLGAIISTFAYRRIKKKMDPRMYNGAMLLGLNGIVVKSHGSTDDIGFANAIETAVKLVKNKVNEDITEEIMSSGHLAEDYEGDIDKIVNG